MISNSYKRVPLAQITVDRAARQRREITTEDLEPSIKTRGVLQPILIRREGMLLVAGERRLEASRRLGLPDIPCRFIEDLPADEAQIIELEENLKRRDLPWRDTCAAIGRLHGLYLSRDPDWPQTKTSIAVGLQPASVAKYLRVYRELNSPRIAGTVSLEAAYNVLSRVDDRRTDDAVNDILEAGTVAFGAAVNAPGGASGQPPVGTPNPANPMGVGTPTPDAPTPPSPPPAESILNVDFATWLETYSGPRFNLVHCDFPYGVNFNSGPQSGAGKWTTYDDSPDVYWDLIKVFCGNLDKFMATSAHLMFWCSADIEMQHATLEMFRQLAPSLVFNKKPLIWLKSDNVGVLADPKRGPRHIYETCLVAAREDRYILRAVSDAYASPTDKAHHVSTKPEPMLRHYLEMFVDEHSRVLDPTCGSGSSLRAAESLGAAFVLGLEVDAEHAASATSALRSFRNLRRASNGK